jgi:hypothetical protein
MRLVCWIIGYWQEELVFSADNVMNNNSVILELSAIPHCVFMLWSLGIGSILPLLPCQTVRFCRVWWNIVWLLCIILSSHCKHEALILLPGFPTYCIATRCLFTWILWLSVVPLTSHHRLLEKMGLNQRSQKTGLIFPSSHCTTRPIVGKYHKVKVKLSPQHAVEAYRVVRCWGSHIV